MNFWKNLHPLLRREENTDYGSANGAILNSIASVLTQAEQDEISIRVQESLATATGAYLDYWGYWFHVVRKPNQSDDDFRASILAYIRLSRGTIQSIINGLKYYLDDAGAIIEVYEPWTNIFYLNKSLLDGVDHLAGEYYRYGVIDVKIGSSIDQRILDIINDFKPAGVKVYTTYLPSYNKDSKVQYIADLLAEETVNDYLCIGTSNDAFNITLGFDDINSKAVVVSSKSLFITDDSKLDSTDVLKNPYRDVYTSTSPNLLPDTSTDAVSYAVPFTQKVDATEGTKYTLASTLATKANVRLLLSALDNSNSVIGDPVISEDVTPAMGSGKREIISMTAPAGTKSIQVSTDNRFSQSDNLVKETASEFTMGCGITNTSWVDDKAHIDLPTEIIQTEVLPQSTFDYILTKGQTYTQSIYVETDAKLLKQTIAFSWFTFNIGHIDDSVEVPIVKVSDGLYRLVATKMWNIDNGGNVTHIFDLFDFTETFDVTTGTYLNFYHPKLELGSVATNWSPAQGEGGYYGSYTMAGTKLATGDKPDMEWSPAEDDLSNYYYADILKTNGAYNEADLRATKNYNKGGASVVFSQVDRNIALNTGTPVEQSSFTSFDLYKLSRPIKPGKAYNVRLYYVSTDTTDSTFSILAKGTTDALISKNKLGTDSKATVVTDSFIASKTDTAAQLSLQMDSGNTGSDIYIVNFKLSEQEL